MFIAAKKHNKPLALMGKFLRKLEFLKQMNKTNKQSISGKANPGGRPKISDKHKKIIRFSIQFTPVEEQIIIKYLDKNNLVKISKSNFFKNIILNSIQNNVINFKRNADPKALLALNKIGNNINQIAKKSNSIDALGDADIKKLHLALETISQIITVL